MMRFLSSNPLNVSREGTKFFPRYEVALRNAPIPEAVLRKRDESNRTYFGNYFWQILENKLGSQEERQING